MSQKMQGSIESNPFPDPVWMNSESFENIFLAWLPRKEVGVLMVQAADDREPRVIIHSLFPDPRAAFFEGHDNRPNGFTLSELRELVRDLELAFEAGPVPTPAPEGNRPEDYNAAATKLLGEIVEDDRTQWCRPDGYIIARGSGGIGAIWRSDQTFGGFVRAGVRDPRR